MMPSRLLIVLLSLSLVQVGTSAPGSDAVTWTVGKPASTTDGGATPPPISFTWTFSRPVKQGVYLDGTPWVVWEEGLQLISVSPSKKTENLLLEDGSTLANGVVDATCINLGEDRLPLDQRIATKAKDLWNDGADVWDGKPVALAPGDCIVTGSGRREARGSFRKMLFNAIGVCNVVGREMTGRYRPPIRMPRDLRAALMTPEGVKVESLPAFDIPTPMNWAGQPVALDLRTAVAAVDADDLLNGPIGNCGFSTLAGYEPGNGKLNHDINGKNDSGYQRDVADRIAACLYTAFDTSVETGKRQRSLNKFIQVGLDYYYMHSLGYPVWNGGGGHPNGIEGSITIMGALLGDATITDAMKHQRFNGAAFGKPEAVYDMLSGYRGSFSRSEALYTVSPAEWKSGKFVLRSAGSGAATLEDCIPRIDMAREDLVINNRSIPYTAIAAANEGSAISVASDFVWPMYSRNRATDARRSFRFLTGAVVRLKGDTTIRKVLDFKASATDDWTENSWSSAGGSGGVVMVYPALSVEEIKRIGQQGELSTGVCTKREAETGEVVLWESWPVTAEDQVLYGFFTSPSHDYFEIKVGDLVQWLPFYHLLNDPGAPGKKLYEENSTHRQVQALLLMQRNAGAHFFGIATSGPNFPSTPTLQALTRYYLLGDRMADAFCKRYDAADQIWVDLDK